MLIATMAAAIYLSAALELDARQIGEATRQLGWLGCGVVLALSSCNYLLRFHRWRLFIEQLGHRVPVAYHLLCYLAGFAFTISPGKAGEAVRSLYLRNHAVSYADSVAALFTERGLDLFAMLLLACLAIANRPIYLPLIAAVSVALAATLVVVNRAWLPALLDNGARRLLPHRQRLAKLLAAGAQALRASRSLLQPRLLARGSILALAAWGAEGYGLYLICKALMPTLSPWAAIGTYALAVLAGSAAFFLPAGIGGTELAMAALLVAQGAQLRAALTATLLCRAATLWFAVLIGIIAATVLELQPDRERAISPA
jgi:uncharacterized protein (TIRG00374 family)